MSLAACSSSGVGGGITRNNGSSGSGNGSSMAGGGGINLGSGGGIGTAGGISLGGANNGCDGPNPPASCNYTATPGCGDGKINQANEECDDGNSLPGDGCSGICKIEPYFTCPTPGQPCVSTIVCGDGVVGPGEACDDGNKNSGDGCAGNCRSVEPGYACRVAGQPCTRVYLCGDGVLDPNEGCDDKNSVNGDGCDSRCRVETGFKCSGSPSVCSPTTCGDGKVEGAESCDDGNTVPFDGCSASCQAEPACPTSGSCNSGCGDGIVLNEECDDGNLRDGDGCSSKCKIEDGFTCANNSPCTMVNGLCMFGVPAVFRDFNFSGSTGGHPDFQPGRNSGFDVATGLVQTSWDADKKPVYSGKATCVTTTNGVTTSKACDPVADAFIHSTASFAQWYRDAPPSSGPIPGTIKLWDNGKGGFVNRFGPNGEQWIEYPGSGAMVNGVTYPAPMWCSNTDCTAVGCQAPPAGMVCLDNCIPNGATNTDACYATRLAFDGNPLFFPIDPPTPKILNDARRSAQLSPAYGSTNWDWEPVIGPSIGLTPTNVKCDASDTYASSNWCHNFSFTTEVKYWFKYDNTTTARLDFTGDDDVWVFVNGKLAVDLGGWHLPLDGGVTIDAAAGATYGLTNGNVYEIGVFQAEREFPGSSFRLTLAGFNLSPSDCRTNCGDGVVAAGEQCDDGAANNTGDYNHCSPTCTLGPRCGDAVVQTPQEQCDDGKNDGSYGGCAPDCTFGPHCGDAVVQSPEEQCDDGVNDNSYGGCSQACKFGPHCGDGIVQADHGEECDDGNASDGDGCNTACKVEVPK